MSLPVFGTDRLLIRDWTEADAPFVFDVYARWEVARWLGAQPRVLGNKDEAIAAIRRWRDRSTEPPFGIWAITERSTGDPKGTVLLVPLPADAPTADAPAADAPAAGADGGPVEIGWHLHPSAWGLGYATEAGAAAARRGFEAGLDEVYAVVRPDNTRSLAVCRRLGMTPLGRTSRWYGTELEAFRLGAPSARVPHS
ncbi:MAG TPA: GNAT family N-acetyltransferase [Actinomycetes bacterium]|nr:GNAT family N-acetyltransferase [Actinomycetes bacterium]